MLNERTLRRIMDRTKGTMEAAIRTSAIKAAEMPAYLMAIAEELRILAEYMESQAESAKDHV